jgi:hypothetical protein
VERERTGGGVAREQTVWVRGQIDMLCAQGSAALEAPGLRLGTQSEHHS